MGLFNRLNGRVSGTDKAGVKALAEQWLKTMRSSHDKKNHKTWLSGRTLHFENLENRELLSVTNAIVTDYIQTPVVESYSVSESAVTTVMSTNSTSAATANPDALDNMVKTDGSGNQSAILDTRLDELNSDITANTGAITRVLDNVPAPNGGGQLKNSTAFGGPNADIMYSISTTSYEETAAELIWASGWGRAAGFSSAKEIFNYIDASFNEAYYGCADEIVNWFFSGDFTEINRRWTSMIDTWVHKNNTNGGGLFQNVNVDSVMQHVSMQATGSGDLGAVAVALDAGTAVAVDLTYILQNSSTANIPNPGLYSVMGEDYTGFYTLGGASLMNDGEATTTLTHKTSLIIKEVLTLDDSWVGNATGETQRFGAVKFANSEPNFNIEADVWYLVEYNSATGTYTFAVEPSEWYYFSRHRGDTADDTQGRWDGLYNENDLFRLWYHNGGRLNGDVYTEATLGDGCTLQYLVKTAQFSTKDRYRSTRVTVGDGFYGRIDNTATNYGYKANADDKTNYTAPLNLNLAFSGYTFLNNYNSKVAPASVEDTLKLQSNPGATNVIYLDFSTMGIDLYSGSISFQEAQYIQEIWQRVAEDYAIFDVNVTTDASVSNLPGGRRITSTPGTTITTYVSRVIIDQSSQGALDNGEKSFVGPSITESIGTYTTPFAKYAGEMTSYSVGRQVITQDGWWNTVSYTGSGMWGPIMGFSNSVANRFTQWSFGEYIGSSTSRKDEIKLLGNQLGYRADEAGDTLENAARLENYLVDIDEHYDALTALYSGLGKDYLATEVNGYASSQATYTVSGVVGVHNAGEVNEYTDYDVYSFTTGARSGKYVVDVAGLGADARWNEYNWNNYNIANDSFQSNYFDAYDWWMTNLNIKVEFMLADGTILATFDPRDSSFIHFQTAELDANTTYFIRVSGVGEGNALTGGFSSYGSLGSYTLSVTEDLTSKVVQGANPYKNAIVVTTLNDVTKMDNEISLREALSYIGRRLENGQYITSTIVFDSAIAGGTIYLNSGEIYSLDPQTGDKTVFRSFDSEEEFAEYQELWLNNTDYGYGELVLDYALASQATVIDAQYFWDFSTQARDTEHINGTNITIDARPVTLSYDGVATTSEIGEADIRVLHVNNITAEIYGLVITGGIANNGASRTEISADHEDQYGGGIYNDCGWLSVIDCTVAGNEALKAGGGIYNTGGWFAVKYPHGTGNEYWMNTYFGKLTIINSEIIGNLASYDYSANSGGVGGGLYNDFFGETFIYNTTIAGNAAGWSGGGIENYGRVKIYNSIIAKNYANVGVDIFIEKDAFTLGRFMGVFLKDLANSTEVYYTLLGSRSFDDDKDNTDYGRNYGKDIDVKTNLLSGTYDALLDPQFLIYTEYGKRDRDGYYSFDATLDSWNIDLWRDWNLTILGTSPAKDKGSATYDRGRDYDLAGYDRTFSGIDMGAYEVQAQPNFMGYSPTVNTYDNTEMNWDYSVIVSKTQGDRIGIATGVDNIPANPDFDFSTTENITTEDEELYLSASFINAGAVTTGAVEATFTITRYDSAGVQQDQLDLFTILIEGGYANAGSYVQIINSSNVFFGSAITADEDNRIEFGTSGELYLNGNVIGQLSYGNNGLIVINDLELGTLDAGGYALEMKLDPANAYAELNEEDNNFAAQFQIVETPSTVVTIKEDVVDSYDGDISLREAIANAGIAYSIEYLADGNEIIVGGKLYYIDGGKFYLRETGDYYEDANGDRTALTINNTYYLTSGTLVATAADYSTSTLLKSSNNASMRIDLVYNAGGYFTVVDSSVDADTLAAIGSNARIWLDSNTLLFASAAQYSSYQFGNGNLKGKGYYTYAKEKFTETVFAPGTVVDAVYNDFGTTDSYYDNFSVRSDGTTYSLIEKGQFIHCGKEYIDLSGLESINTSAIYNGTGTDYDSFNMNGLTSVALTNTTTVYWYFGNVWVTKGATNNITGYYRFTSDVNLTNITTAAGTVLGAGSYTTEKVAAIELNEGDTFTNETATYTYDQYNDIFIDGDNVESTSLPAGDYSAFQTLHQATSGTAMTSASKLTIKEGDIISQTVTLGTTIYFSTDLADQLNNYDYKEAYDLNNNDEAVVLSIDLTDADTANDLLALTHDLTFEGRYFYLQDGTLWIAVDADGIEIDVDTYLSDFNAGADESGEDYSLVDHEIYIAFPAEYDYATEIWTTTPDDKFKDGDNVYTWQSNNVHFVNSRGNVSLNPETLKQLDDLSNWQTPLWVATESDAEYSLNANLNDSDNVYLNGAFVVEEAAFNNNVNSVFTATIDMEFTSSDQSLTSNKNILSVTNLIGRISYTGSVLGLTSEFFGDLYISKDGAYETATIELGDTQDLYCLRDGNYVKIGTVEYTYDLYLNDRTTGDSLPAKDFGAIGSGSYLIMKNIDLGVLGSLNDPSESLGDYVFSMDLSHNEKTDTNIYGEIDSEIVYYDADRQLVRGNDNFYATNVNIVETSSNIVTILTDIINAYDGETSLREALLANSTSYTANGNRVTINGVNYDIVNGEFYQKVSGKYYLNEETGRFYTIASGDEFLLMDDTIVTRAGESILLNAGTQVTCRNGRLYAVENTSIQIYLNDNTRICLNTEDYTNDNYVIFFNDKTTKVDVPAGSVVEVVANAYDTLIYENGSFTSVVEGNFLRKKESDDFVDLSSIYGSDELTIRVEVANYFGGLKLYTGGAWTEVSPDAFTNDLDLTWSWGSVWTLSRNVVDPITGNTISITSYYQISSDMEVLAISSYGGYVEAGQSYIVSATKESPIDLVDGLALTDNTSGAEFKWHAATANFECTRGDGITYFTGQYYNALDSETQYSSNNEVERSEGNTIISIVDGDTFMKTDGTEDLQVYFCNELAWQLNEYNSQEIYNSATNSEALELTADATGQFEKINLVNNVLFEGRYFVDRAGQAVYTTDYSADGLTDSSVWTPISNVEEYIAGDETVPFTVYVWYPQNADEVFNKAIGVNYSTKNVVFINNVTSSGQLFNDEEVMVNTLEDALPDLDTNGDGINDAYDTTDGKVSLREAIWYASNGGDPDADSDNIVIQVNTDIITDSNPVFKLQYGELNINYKNLESEIQITIDGSSANGGSITIDAQGLSRVFNVTTSVAGSVPAILFKGLTITGGQITAGTNEDIGGAAINSVGIVTIDDCVITGNNGGFGGAIRNTGSMTIIDSTITQNTGISGTVYNSGDNSTLSSVYKTGTYKTGEMYIYRTQIAGNTVSDYGGAVTHEGITLEVYDSVFSANKAGYDGAALFVMGSNSTVDVMTTKIVNSDFVGNYAVRNGGGLWSNRVVTVVNSILYGNISEADKRYNEVYFKTGAGQKRGSFSGDSGFNIATSKTLSGIDCAAYIKSAVTNPDLLFTEYTALDVSNWNSKIYESWDLTPVSGSVTIDSGDATSVADIEKSQHGTTRVNGFDGLYRIYNTIIDIGAYEFQPDNWFDGNTTATGNYTATENNEEASITFNLLGADASILPDTLIGTLHVVNSDGSTPTFSIVPDENGYYNYFKINEKGEIQSTVSINSDIATETFGIIDLCVAIGSGDPAVVTNFDLQIILQKQLTPTTITEVGQIDNNKVTIKYNAVPNAEGYQVRYKEINSSTWTIYSPTLNTTTAAIEANFSVNTTYVFQVRAFADGWIDSEWSDQVNSQDETTGSGNISEAIGLFGDSDDLNGFSSRQCVTMTYNAPPIFHSIYQVNGADQVVVLNAVARMTSSETSISGWQINWGDGTSDTFESKALALSAVHAYSENSSFGYNITINLLDEKGFGSSIVYNVGTAYVSSIQTAEPILFAPVELQEGESEETIDVIEENFVVAESISVQHSVVPSLADFLAREYKKAGLDDPAKLFGYRTANKANDSTQSEAILNAFFADEQTQLENDSNDFDWIIENEEADELVAGTSASSNAVLFDDFFDDYLDD